MNAQPQRPDDALSPEVRDDDPRRWLSALADGDADAVQRGCELWRSDPEARRSWHAYHLIGDVLRSDELAGDPGRDAAFMARLRERLAAEPVPLAPAPVASKPADAWRSRWLFPAAAAAGFVVVAGVLVVTRLAGPAGVPGAPVLAGGGPSSGVVLVGTNPAGAAPAAQVRGTVIRDPRLDEMLRAHQAARGGMPVAVPGGTLRQVEVVTPAGTPR
ncbi:MAG: sigma-E factor negative regulatory protein [Rubrivivax sp.]|nr:sigma-E factor negative regulatory protein [Rubrivivax sp.]